MKPILNPAKLSSIALLSLSTVASAGLVSIDVTNGGTATAFGGATGNGEGADKAIDNGFYSSKYLNLGELNTGLIIQATNTTTPVTGMILVAANDSSERDPASYILEGSNDGTNWSPISNGALALPTARNTLISNFSVSNQRITFANATAWSQYRITFPTVRNSTTANSMQIAEISLLGLYDPGADVLDLQSYSATAFGPGGFPVSEGPANAFDNNETTKYLNFGKEGNGLTLTTTGSLSVVSGITLAHANDAVARDPANFTLRGSLDGVNFIDIVTNQPINSGMGLFEGTTINFANSTAYRDYQFVVTALRASVNADSFQFSELQLHGALVPEPGSAVLLSLLGIGALARRRR